MGDDARGRMGGAGVAMRLARCGGAGLEIGFGSGLG